METNIELSNQAKEEIFDILKQKRAYEKPTTIHPGRILLALPAVGIGAFASIYFTGCLHRSYCGNDGGLALIILLISIIFAAVIIFTRSVFILFFSVLISTVVFFVFTRTFKSCILNKTHATT